MEKKYKKQGTIVTVIALVQLVGALAIMIAGVMNKSITNLQSNILMGAALLLYWILMDLVEPRVAHRFDDITEAQKQAYPKYVLFDLLGFAGIAYFLMGMGSNQNGSIIGAVIYAVSLKPKQENQKIFMGKIVPEEDTAEEEAEVEIPENSGEEPAQIGERTEES